MAILHLCRRNCEQRRRPAREKPTNNKKRVALVQGETSYRNKGHPMRQDSRSLCTVVPLQKRFNTPGQVQQLNKLSRSTIRFCVLVTSKKWDKNNRTLPSRVFLVLRNLASTWNASETRVIFAGFMIWEKTTCAYPAFSRHMGEYMEMRLLELRIAGPHVDLSRFFFSAGGAPTEGIDPSAISPRYYLA